MEDKKLNEVTTVNSGTLANVKTFLAVMKDGTIQQMSKEDLASVVGGLIGTVTTEKDGIFPAKRYKSSYLYKEINGGMVLSVTLARYSGNFIKIRVPYTQNSLGYKEGVFVVDMNTGNVLGINIKNFDLEARYKLTDNLQIVTLYVKGRPVTVNRFCMDLGIPEGVAGALELAELSEMPSDATIINLS